MDGGLQVETQNANFVLVLKGSPLPVLIVALLVIHSHLLGNLAEVNNAVADIFVIAHETASDFWFDVILSYPRILIRASAKCYDYWYFGIGEACC